MSCTCDCGTETNSHSCKGIHSEWVSACVYAEIVLLIITIMHKLGIVLLIMIQKLGNSMTKIRYLYSKHDIVEWTGYI